MLSFSAVLQKYRKLSFSERDKGDRFERLIQAYLYTDPKYAHLKKVWLWSEFPHRQDFGSHDIGIDLVAQTIEGEYWAVQCKAYREEARITKEEVDTFLSTSGRSFENESGERVHFSQRLWVSTTNNWSSKANETLQNQHPAVTRINLTDLQEAPVEWDKIDDGIFGEKARQEKKTLRHHQSVALEKTTEYFANGGERGKLIMACGTGKTFTSLKIAEAQAGNDGVVLFLVPSIALLGQTLREWTADADEPINAIAICSDREVTRDKKKNEDAETFSVVDLAVPASTKVNDIIKQFEYFDLSHKKGMTVVFSTYQSIDVIAETQKRLESIGGKYSKFDLIICDEAHRTTGVTLADSDESAFVKVHDNDFINSEKRLYMTATPRLYGEESKRKAQDSNAVIASMDDESLYGKEIYRIGFGMAVEQGLLSDYKVMILTLSESDVTPEVQKVLANTEQEIANMDDVSKLIGTINAMSKQIINDSGIVTINDPEPMRRAVAFVPTIKASRKISNTFNEIADTYHDSVPDLKQETLVKLRSEHVDGSMSATDRDKHMSWLKEEPAESNESRVLTNVRCLSEGVDVPSLDAVMFLSARNSQVDVVQSVGRVMRKSPGKKYGYIIIPIVIPSDIKPEDALNDNERFKVVWTVLNALRAHDDRFNATVNKIELNKKKPSQILIGRPDPDGDGDPFNDSDESKKSLAKADQTSFHFDELQTAIYAKMVNKVGEREYWENWAKDIADIAERHIKRITKIVDEDDEAHMAFREFVRGLKKNLNPSISEVDAIQMLSQHIITRPVFEALFDKYSFANSNPVSQAMQKALDAIEHKAVNDEERELMEGFYRSVRRRAEGVDNAEGKQKIIVELYDKFFKTGFPKVVDQLGIVYTPVEVVDFIIHSVGDVLQKEFGRSLSDEGVNIIDPFTGTGTFITRLLQSGLIKKEDLERKYKNEIFANEFLLLAYYIGAVNIENVYHDIMGKEEYDEFPGIVLTDTFQLYEDDDNTKLFSDALAGNFERLERQKQKPLRVIIGNPPYSVGQTSANDNAQNQNYPKLDNRIASTYAALTSATNKNSLYNSYVKAIRWASDRIIDDGGIVGFITNYGWLESNSFDGFRKSIENEFDSVYTINLRGAIRGKSGDGAKREGQNVFDILTGVGIVILVKSPQGNSTSKKAKIKYYDIGDYLQRKEKLDFLKENTSALFPGIKWTDILPNESGDWVNFRNDIFNQYISIEPQKRYTSDNKSYFNTSSNGLKTQRDAWCYNSSKNKLIENVGSSIDFYKSEQIRLRQYDLLDRKVHIDYDTNKISWTENVINGVVRDRKIHLDRNHVRSSIYRPFYKQFTYYDKSLNERTYQLPSMYPLDITDPDNLIISVSGSGSSKDFSSLISNSIIGLDTLEKTQAFPLYYFEKTSKTQQGLFDSSEDYVRKDGISDFIFKEARDRYVDNRIEKEDIFYYVYGLLHSPDYRREFANDLKKMLPRLPLVDKLEDFWAFSESGSKLARLHIDYEEVDPYEAIKVSGTQHGNYHVEKLKFSKKKEVVNGKEKSVADKSTIIYNEKITIENIPEKSYEYIVNGKSAIEWILDRYQVKTDKASGIINDPNDWAKEVGNPRYILDLLLSVINVSVQTVDIVNGLPKLTFETKDND